jgi:periplasmic protein TonB
MNRQAAALCYSAGIHALVVLTIIVVSASVIPRQKILVLDFSIQQQSDSIQNRPAIPGPQPSAPAVREPLPEIPAERRPAPQEARVEPVKKTVKKPAPKVQRAGNVEAHVPVQVSPAGSAEPAASLPSGALRPGIAAASPGGASSQGSGEGDYIRKRYLKEHFAFIHRILNSKRSYPKIAQRMGWAGTVKVSFVICTDGTVKDVRVLSNSGFEVLDRNAVDTVKNCAPYPAPPVMAEIVVPIIYRLE